MWHKVNSNIPLWRCQLIGPALIDTPCGFDPRFFEILTKYFENKPEAQRDGLLIMDGMKTRKILDYSTNDLQGVDRFWK